ncbi:hypothetical protein NPIL_70821 [Nephila pilipes]|uniref:Uncharacterized protein n=1 Tax=Nephila pilipes TaxID=299642 RepID=A0A8X6N897_NEPPI|nr:hypothetical protein NPIL_70821 [Nephila pilipes]
MMMRLDDLVLEESGTGEEEHISGGQHDSESEMSVASNSEDEDNVNRSTDDYMDHLKKNINIIESWKWKKKPIKKTKQTPRNICIHVPAIIRPTKELTDISDIWKCLINDRLIESRVEETDMYICFVIPNYFCSRDARDTDGAEVEALFGLAFFGWCLPRK